MNDTLDPPLKDSASLPKSLRRALIDLHRQPYPHVSNPPSCKRRASVALILRVRPAYLYWPECPTPLSNLGSSVEEKLDAFFSQEWVQHGEPEALFIKRATRVGDRWTGHVAFPGGKRDPEDLDDECAAIRETLEEVGFDLTTNDCIPVGNLPERVVTTSWGAVPLMVLCPFVFLWVRSDSPTLRLQPTEVAETHWVSLRTLLSPSSRAFEYVDLSERYAKRAGNFARLACRFVVGLMQFSAIQLAPTESLCCCPIQGPPPETCKAHKSQWWRQIWGARGWTNRAEPHQPLRLWGLTLGIMADLLDMLPPHTAISLWKYPTFTVPDLCLIVNVLTYRLRKRNTLKLVTGAGPSNRALDDKMLTISELSGNPEGNEVGIGGLGASRYSSSSDKDGGSTYAVGIMLQGYYQRVRLAIYVFLAWRIALGGLTVAYIWRRLRR